MKKPVEKSAKDSVHNLHTIIRRTIGQYYVNQAVRHGAPRATVQHGSVTFLHRFGGALNVNLHFRSTGRTNPYVICTNPHIKAN